MSWGTFDWKPADGQSLGGDLGVGHGTWADAPTDLVGARSFELLGTDRRGAWAALDPEKGDKIGGNVYTADKLQSLVLEAMDGAFETILGEGLGLGPAVEISSPDAQMLFLRLPMTSVDNEEVVLISAYDAAVAGELSAHVVALQALSSEATTAPQPAPVAQRNQEYRAAAGQSSSPSATAAASAATATVGAQGLPSNVRPAQLPELTPGATTAPGYNIDLLLGVNLQVAVEIGRTNLPIRDVLALTPGSIIELDKLAGEKVDILINGRPIAQGEVVVVDENFGVRITDVVSRQARLSPAGH
jgi:flagellar motor switch protein FliN